MVIGHTLETISPHPSLSVSHGKQKARHSSSGRHHGAAEDTIVHHSVLPPCFRSFTGQVVSSFHTLSPDITLKCCLLLSSTWGSLLPPFLSRLGNTLSCADYLFLPNCSLVLALPLLFLPYSAHAGRDSEIQLLWYVLLNGFYCAVGMVCEDSFGIIWYWSLEIFALSLFWHTSGGFALKTWNTFYCGTFTMLLTFPRL